MAAWSLPPTSKTLLYKLARAANDAEMNTVYKRFLETYGPTMLCWCGRWGLQKADAKDVTQEVAIKLLEKMKMFEFRRWFKVVLQHAVKDLLAGPRAVAEGQAVQDRPASKWGALGEGVRPEELVKGLVEELQPGELDRLAGLKGLNAPADAAAWDGDFAKFEAVYGPVILRRAGRWGLGPAEAEELRRQLLGALARAMKTVKDADLPRFRSWLRAVVHNAAIDCLRELSRKSYRSGSEKVQELIENAAARDDFVAAIEQQELLQEAEARVQPTVKERDWEIYKLRLYEGKGNAEIATALGMKESTVGVVAHRMRAKVKETCDRLSSPDGLPEEEP
jgi:RNA polymerase sigma factor (sigma-70 family)